MFKKKLKIYYEDLLKKGIKGFIYFRVIKWYEMTICKYQKIKNKKNHFMFNKKIYDYFFHVYNYTWKNERIVEIPIFWEIVAKNKNKRVLEIGNVLPHYFSVNHNVVDKYELGDNVINEDIVNFKPTENYNIIIAISTLEHVGFDESPKDPQKILKTIAKLKSLLAKNGKIYFSFPVGYNKNLDKLISEKKIFCNTLFALQRVSSNNLWRQVTTQEALKSAYGSPFPYANSIIVGVINK